MANSIEVKTDKYIDTPLTNFPVSEDSWKRMMDVTSSLMPLVTQYNQYFAAGNITACNTLIASNPTLSDCFYNAEKFNELRDAIIAIERFYLEDVTAFIETVAQNTVGINDNPTEEQAALVAYSAQYIDKIHKTRTLAIPASGWSNAYPYTQTVTVEGITAADTIKVIGVHTPSGATLEQVKAWNKAAGFLMCNPGGVGNGTITFKAYKKPVVDFQLITEGA